MLLQASNPIILYQLRKQMNSTEGSKGAAFLLL